MDIRDLPEPESDELSGLISNRVGRRIYGELYSVREGLDINELKARIPEFADQMHFDRRLRDLDKPFVLERERQNGRLVYRITGKRDAPRATGRISKSLRARILFRDGSRCQMCGASPQKDPAVDLAVDHKVPLHWGGTNDEDNLWTLCRMCNEGKKAFFSSADEHAEEIRAAIGHPEVHRRIGELLKAFGIGEPIPSYLLQLVASAQQYQEDWHRRLRELRDLGWDYEVTKRREGGRVASYYTLTRDGGWPATGTIRQALRRAQRDGGREAA